MGVDVEESSPTMECPEFGGHCRPCGMLCWSPIAGGGAGIEPTSLREPVSSACLNRMKSKFLGFLKRFLRVKLCKRSIGLFLRRVNPTLKDYTEPMDL